MSRTPETPALVSAEWALRHLEDPAVRFVDVDYDRSPFEQGHIPGAACWTWETDLIDPVSRDFASADALAGVLSRSGIDSTTHVVLYGDDDWYAAWALWQLKAHGFTRVSLLDGGRRYWQTAELPYDAATPSFKPTGIELAARDDATRMRLGELHNRLDDPDLSILDVRTVEEYTGALTAPDGYPAIAQRAGHVPGAIRAPWEETLADDGRFRPVDELRRSYAALGLDEGREVTMYCGVGVRSSHTWFVLHELLGYRRARNYDGSWAEWGSVVGAPIEKGRPGAP